jgi:D-sedoheptulose 7-phosphate isomerase
MSSEGMFAEQFLAEAAQIVARLDRASLEKAAKMIGELHATGGRLFILGVGGSAANASHAVNDFRKIAGIEAYAPTDNVSELTARTNDEGWATVFSEWLKVSHGNAKDAVLVFSVGGGDVEKNVSPNIVFGLQEAKQRNMRVFAIVGRDGGYARRVADASVLIPIVDASRVTPHTEAFQAVVWHCLVSHPKLQKNATKW